MGLDLSIRRTATPALSSDVAVHALAQLPDRVKLEVTTGDTLERSSLELLARAYGVAGRLDIRAGNAPANGRYIAYSAKRDTMTVPTMRGDRFAELIESLYDVEDGPAALRESDVAFAGQRVVIVTNRPTHYRVPLFNRLAERLFTAGASLCVLFAGDLAAKPWMRPEPMHFEHIGLRTRTLLPRVPAVPTDLERRLRQLRPTLLLSGSLSPAIGGRVAHFAERRGIRFGVWSGEISPSPTSSGLLRAHQRRWILRRCSFAIAYGYRAGEYLRSVAPSLPVVYGRNTSPFEPPPDRSLRTGPVEILTVSQAIPRKRLDLVVDAVRRLDEGTCRFTVIGAGPCLEALRARAHGHDNIDVRGLVGSDQVLDAYRDADVFVFPSAFDPFGLVLVEAMGCGLATVVSPDPGAVGDLAVTRGNALIVDDPTAESWAASIRELVETPSLRTSLGAAGHATIRRRWTLDHAADAMVGGLRLGILASAARRAS